MVWTCVEPTGFGKYFPNGDFVSWYSDMDAYFYNVLTEEQRQSHNNRPVSLRYEASRKFKENLGDLEDHEKPKDYTIDSDPKRLASIFLLTNRLIAIDEDFKTVLQNLEPDTHQIWPLKLLNKKSRSVGKPVFGLRVGTFLDTFNETESDPASWEMSKGSFRSMAYTKSEYNNIAVTETKAQGRHLWRESRLGGFWLMFSDELKDEVSSRGIDVPRLYKLKSA